MANDCYSRVKISELKMDKVLELIELFESDSWKKSVKETDGELVHNEHYQIFKNEESITVEYSFDTLGLTPIKSFVELSKDYPGFLFDVDFHESEGWFRGFYRIKDGVELEGKTYKYDEINIGSHGEYSDFLDQLKGGDFELNPDVGIPRKEPKWISLDGPRKELYITHEKEIGENHPSKVLSVSLVSSRLDDKIEFEDDIPF